jgi:Carbohydrate-selective porin, OprB family
MTSIFELRGGIVETYYTAHVWRGIHVAPSLQYILNPAYNRDRGPVPVLTFRLNLEFWGIGLSGTRKLCPETLAINRMRVFANGRNSARCSARVRLIRLKVGAGGCSGCGLVAAADLTAMGIESFFVCRLLILFGLGKSEKSENRS